MIKQLAFGLIIIAVLASGASFGATLYVDPIDGDDANSGDSWETALKTITRAIQTRP